MNSPLSECGADVVIGDLAEVGVRSIDRRMSSLPDALRSFRQIAAVAAARRPAIFFDFDGTLSEIVDEPGAAALVPGAGKALESLAALCRWLCCPAAGWTTSRPGRHSWPLVRREPRLRNDRPRRDLPQQ